MKKGKIFALSVLLVAVTLFSGFTNHAQKNNETGDTEEILLFVSVEADTQSVESPIFYA